MFFRLQFDMSFASFRLINYIKHYHRAIPSLHITCANAIEVALSLSLRSKFHQRRYNHCNQYSNINHSPMPSLQHNSHSIILVYSLLQFISIKKAPHNKEKRKTCADPGESVSHFQRRTTLLAVQSTRARRQIRRTCLSLLDHVSVTGCDVLFAAVDRV